MFITFVVYSLLLSFLFGIPINVTKLDEETISNYNSKAKEIKNLFNMRNNFDYNQTISHLVYYYLFQILSNTDQKIIAESLENNTPCYLSFIENFKNETLPYSTFLYSGKTVNDIGNYKGCISNNLSYNFITFKAKKIPFLNETFINFTQVKNYFFGFCIFNNCNEMWKKVFNETLNEPLFEFLRKNNLDVYSVSLYDQIPDVNNYETSFVYVTIIFLIYICLRLLISLFGAIIYINDFSRYTTETQRLMYNNKTTNDQSSNYKLISSSQKIYKKRIFYKLYKLFSYLTGLKYIFRQDKNKIYNKDKSNFVCVTKLFLCYLYTFNHVFYTLINYPHNISGDKTFLSSYWLILIKLSSFSYEAIICLDGILTAFKLMNFYKKYKNFSILGYLYFSASLFYQFITFALIFFLFYLKIDSIGSLFGYSYTLKNFLTISFEKRLCYKYPKFILIPFYYQYYEVNHKKNDLTECFRPFYLMYEKFFCVVLTLIIFYFLIRLKSKIFEVIILLLSCSIAISMIFYYKDLDFPNTYDLHFLLGDVRSIKQPHLVFPSFFLGTIGGVTYFYFCDIVSENPLIDNYSYLPFKYTYWLIKLYDKLSNLVKILIASTMIIIIILLSSIFIFYIKIEEVKEDTSFNIPFDRLLKFMFIYERKFFNICLMILLLCLLGFKNKFIQNIFSFNFLICFDKISTCYLIWIDSFSYLLFGYAKMHMFLNIYNLLILSIGLFNLLYFLSIFMVISIELPIRIIIKKIGRNKLQKSLSK